MLDTFHLHKVSISEVKMSDKQCLGRLKIEADHNRTMVVSTLVTTGRVPYRNMARKEASADEKNATIMALPTRYAKY